MAGKIENEASSSSSRRSENRGESVIVDVGKRRSSCGYCKSVGRTSISHGLWAHSITVDDYQDLLDQGWRRSGCFLYKPEMENTCCPSYTIRLKAGDFLPSKEQLRVSRRMQRFLDGTFDGKKPVLLTDESNASNSAAKQNDSKNSEERSKEEQSVLFFSDHIDDAIHAWGANGEFPTGFHFPRASVKKISHAKKKLIEGFEDLQYSSNISFQIAAALKRSNISEISPETISEKLTDLLNKRGELAGFTARACKGHINIHSASKQISSREGSEIVNTCSQAPRSGGAKRICMVKNSACPQKKQQKLEIRLRRSSFDPEEYALYRRYQIKVHNDSEDHVMESSYKRFLVDTPIVFVPPTGDDTVPPCGFGSFHQQYIIDERLVAVGVVDILPRCLSSKYLFWDPDLAFLSLGKYSALQEIGWLNENQVYCPSLQYYYLGYYIHSCSKMKYKASYVPSELLCPLRYQWVPFHTARPLLDKRPYVILSDFANLQNEESSQQQNPDCNLELQHHNPGEEMIAVSDEDEDLMEPDFEGSGDDSDSETNDVLSLDELKDGNVGNILVGLKNSRYRYKDLVRVFGSTENNYLESRLHRYKKVVGSGLSERMVYSL
ncbi:Arginyl-trna--protein transferase [Thalictrum thalictroides]|uniref:Arginyl-tRNA--protein transferase n=1 Tax=Thalictrum thalictroides TaxID=46969 RepID=A0A7J6VT82_THATH|nr:Arginyl-trna--protein transferase [Thalictrum thalictroides]